MLRDPYAADYPPRSTAIAIIDAMKTASGWQEVDMVTGIDDARQSAEDCYLVYGHPELEPAALTQWLAEGLIRQNMRPTSAGPLGEVGISTASPLHEGG